MRRLLFLLQLALALTNFQIANERADATARPRHVRLDQQVHNALERRVRNGRVALLENRWCTSLIRTVRVCHRDASRQRRVLTKEAFGRREREAKQPRVGTRSSLGEERVWQWAVHRRARCRARCGRPRQGAHEDARSSPHVCVSSAMVFYPKFVPKISRDTIMSVGTAYR